MANPRIEEVDDASDPEEMDVDAFDFARPQGTLGPSRDNDDDDDGDEDDDSDGAEGPLLSADDLEAMLRPKPPGHEQPPPPQTARQLEARENANRERTKHYQCLYPVYFDATRSREQGRRVQKALAVPNPLARDIVDALQDIGARLAVPFQVVFEPAKCHPKDWANPGRVRVLVKREGTLVHRGIQNKHHLYRLVAEYLRQHPTTEESPMQLRLQGMPMPKDKLPPPAIPRGFKIGSILPLHSPALSGGGVSDNFFKDIMAGMGGQAPDALGGAGGAGGASGGGQKKVKDKKKGK